MKSKLMLFILILNSLLLCNNNSRQTEEFYIQIPENWIQIPKQAVDFLLKELNRPAAFDVRDEKYSYLYQRKENDTLFTLPHVRIQINNYRRLSKSEFLENQFMEVDKTTGYLWSIKDSTINVIIPTEKGSINFYCISDSASSKENKALFINMIKSMVVSYDLVYKDDFLHNTPIIRDLIKKQNLSTLFAVIFIAVVIVIKRIKRKSVVK